MPKAFSRLPNVKTTASAAMSLRCANRPMPDRRRAVRQLAARHAAGQRDVVVRAGVHAVEAERAVHVADLQRQEQPQLAPPRQTTSGACGARRPLMQSAVRHAGTSPVSRTRSSSGDIVEATKLNWPIGQSYLQNVAPVKTVSTTSAATK